MKNSIIIAAILLLMFLEASASTKPGLGSEEQESIIHILVVADPDVVSRDIEAHLDFLERTWDYYNGFFASPETAIKIVDNGEHPAEPLVYFTPLSGTASEQIDSVKFRVSDEGVNGSNPSIRDRKAADVIIAFTEAIDSDPEEEENPNGEPDPSRPICGFAPQDNWAPPGGEGGVFVDPDLDGLDLRGRDDEPGSPGYYVALVAAGTDCLNEWTTAHEFGHLFGAGHYDVPPHLSPDSDPWLFSDSRARGHKMRRNPLVGRVTAVAEVFPSFCEETPQGCIHDAKYSALAVEDRNNVRAINKTARSVANYMRGVPEDVTAEICDDGIDNNGDNLTDAEDPDCTDGDESGPPPSPPSTCDSTVPPINVYGYLVRACADPEFPGWSHYRIDWQHPCPSEVDYYELWFSQPDGVDYDPGWIIFRSQTDALVDGAEARMRIKSCGSSGCSPCRVQASLRLIFAEQCRSRSGIDDDREGRNRCAAILRD